jgi:hypothetical protein
MADTDIKIVDGVGIRLDPSGDEYEVGVMFGGAFHVIQKIKAGRVTRFIKREADKAEAAKQAAAVKAAAAAQAAAAAAAAAPAPAAPVA